MLTRIHAGWAFLLLISSATGSYCQAAPVAGEPLSGDKIPPGAYTGKLLSLPKEDGSFTVEITSQKMELKPNAQTLAQAGTKFQQDFTNGMNSIQRDLATGKDSAYHQNRLRDHLAWYQRTLPAYQPGGSHYPYQSKNEIQTVDFIASATMKIRNQDPPLEMTDKGVPKKYTPKELTKLKGSDPKLPGYEAKKEDLQTGALVKITLARAKPPSKAELTAKDVLNGPKNKVTVIVIVSKDGNPPMSPGKVPAAK